MSQTDITVILTVYNQRPESIETSMRSVAAQTGCTYQLLVADDHSSESFEDEATALASELGISNFTYVRHPENVQTVRNILHALPYAEGQFIKALGAGDALYDESTLAAIVAFCRDNDVHAGFGDIVIDLPDRPSSGAPKRPECYPPEGCCGHRDLLLMQLSTADWIPDCCQFFEKRRLEELLALLAETYEVRYCEDFAETIALLDGDVHHLHRPILLYEWGTGISTGGSIESRKRLYADHERLYRRLHEAHPDDSSYRSAYGKFKLRQFLALKTPLYPLLQKIVAKGYTKAADA